MGIFSRKSKWPFSVLNMSSHTKTSLSGEPTCAKTTQQPGAIEKVPKFTIYICRPILEMAKWSKQYLGLRQPSFWEQINRAVTLKLRMQNGKSSFCHSQVTTLKYAPSPGRSDSSPWPREASSALIWEPGLS